MKIGILSQNFYSELISTGQIFPGLSEVLAAEGCDISVIAGQHIYFNRGSGEKKIVH